jgi:periplasmic mercuric ion binding protein
MRQLLLAVAAMAAVGLSSSAVQADKVEVKGVHLCCPACQKAVKGILDKVEGISEIACDRQAKTVTFTAADEKTAKKAFYSLMKGGFYGEASADGKAIAASNKAGKDKAEKVTVNNVHVCCNSCRKAIQALFPDAKISYTGSGAQRNVTISGENLEAAAVLNTLRKGGFNGTAK